VVTASLSRAAENYGHTTLHILKIDFIRFSELKKPSAKIATPQDHVEHGYLGHFRLEQNDRQAITVLSVPGITMTGVAART